MRSNRREVMALLMAGAAAPALSSCTGGPDPAAAWRAPGAGESDLRRFALAHAILAPNPHNRQPWLVEMVGDDEVRFFVDVERLLPATDPFDRQITIGCGAFLELFDLAVRQRGKTAEIALFPDGEPQPRLDQRPIAHIRITDAAAERDPLFDQIVRRRTNREPFGERVPDAALLARIAALGAIGAAQSLTIESVQGGALRDELRRLAWDAFEREFRTPAAHMETVNLIRVGRKEIAEHRDGIAIEGGMVEFAKMLGMVNRSTLADIDNSQTRDGLMEWRPLALEAPAYVWITTPDNTRATQIAAGRAYARLNLAATAEGLAMHPWSQALQEYPEMAALHAQAERLLDAPGEARVQMLARVGYGPEVKAAPRRGLDAHIRA
ncbi:MAG: nitroreductase family protein [Hydrogenophilaceae bacterium]|nr:nitroreductase family protein [Hydrogenophilaceae bacterium]